MIRIAGSIALGLLAAFALTAWLWWSSQGAESWATPLRLDATPAATPILLDPFDFPSAVPVSLVIQNLGLNDHLLGGSTPVASRVVVHLTRLIDGRREMASEPDGIRIPAGETLVLEPAAGHLMLVGLRDTLVQGRTFPLTLHFERAGEVTVTARVRRKVDAAGVEPIPPVAAGDLRISLASAPPAPASTPAAMRIQ